MQIYECLDFFCILEGLFLVLPMQLPLTIGCKKNQKPVHGGESQRLNPGAGLFFTQNFYG